jgi:hypothetical protein
MEAFYEAGEKTSGNFFSIETPVFFFKNKKIAAGNFDDANG